MWRVRERVPLVSITNFCEAATLLTILLRLRSCKEVVERRKRKSDNDIVKMKRKKTEK